jgi:hypothetical protein
MPTLFDDGQLANTLHLDSVEAAYALRAHSRAEHYLRVELGVEFGSAPRTLTKRIPRTRTYQALTGPLASVTSVTVDGVALTAGTHYEVTDRGIACPGGFGQGLATDGDWCTLVAVYVAGFAIIPGELREWALVLGAQAYGVGAAPGVRSISVEGVTETYADSASSAEGISLPDDVLKALRARYGSGRRLTGSVLIR